MLSFEGDYFESVYIYAICMTNLERFAFKNVYLDIKVLKKL